MRKASRKDLTSGGSAVKTGFPETHPLPKDSPLWHTWGLPGTRSGPMYSASLYIILALLLDPDKALM